MDFWFWFFVAATVFIGVCASGWWAFQAYRDGQFERAWRWLRVFSLGGATTLDRDLSDVCKLCQNSMDAGEKVRTLSCDHVFHRCDDSTCEGGGVDTWLFNMPEMMCPDCAKTPRPVLPWKAPPPPASTTSESSSVLEYGSLPELSSGLDDRDKPLLPRSETV